MDEVGIAGTREEVETDGRSKTGGALFRQVKKGTLKDFM